MITTAIILLIIGVLMIAYALRAIPDEKISLKGAMSLLGVLLIMFAGLLLGEYKGAYKQLRGGYQIEYTINQQEEVTDTIIHFY